jgi:dihydroorotate dehydrogenase
LDDEERELLELADAFLSADLHPSWFTLNLSCPNTEDDPSGNQSADKAEQLAGALVQRIGAIPLWVKISPALSPAQYSGLLRAFAKVGVRAVIATNTLGQPAPDGTTAGISGGKLFAEAAQAVKILSAEQRSAALPLDIIACGNVMDKQALALYRASGVRAFQYWSALIYRGPFAARLLEQEWRTLDV